MDRRLHLCLAEWRRDPGDQMYLSEADADSDLPETRPERFAEMDELDRASWAKYCCQHKPGEKLRDTEFKHYDVTMLDELSEKFLVHRALVRAMKSLGIGPIHYFTRLQDLFSFPSKDPEEAMQREVRILLERTERNLGDLFGEKEAAYLKANAARIRALSVGQIREINRRERREGRPPAYYEGTLVRMLTAWIVSSPGWLLKSEAERQEAEPDSILH